MKHKTLSVSDGINFFRVGRLALKYTNPVIIALIVAALALIWGLWQQNKALKIVNERLEVVQSKLLESAEQEAKAWSDYKEKLSVAQQQADERNQRLKKVAKKPEIKATANSPVAPILKHALQELRKSDEAVRGD